MKRLLVMACAVAMAGAVAVAVPTFAGNAKKFSGFLHGYEEVPAVSTVANGTFKATINNDGSIGWKLTYTALEGNVTQAHIHFGQPLVNGGISAFLCSNLGNGPAGTQACPPGPATLSGTITAAEIVGPAAQGITTGELAELVKAIRAGVAYANVHSSLFPGGEIRAQLDD